MPNLSIVKNQNIYKRRVLNILIVDDDTQLGNLLKQIIEFRGHSVTFVDDGPRCITHCKLHAYDLIFIDYHMEGLNGVDVATIVKTEKDIDKNTLIFAYTGDQSLLAINHFKNAGMNGAIIKPTDVKSIESLIQNLEIRTELDQEIIKSLNRRNKDLIIFV